MKLRSDLTKYYAVTLVGILAIAALVVPFPAEEVPEWKILFVDENFLPGGNRNLGQSIDNAYFDHKSEYVATTDKNGYVTFPKRYLWAGAAERGIAVIAGALGWETRTVAAVSVSGQGCSASVVWKEGDAKMPDKLVCPR